MNKPMSVTEFLKKLPCDKAEYCRFIEDESYDRLLYLVNIKETEGMTDEKHDILQIQYRYDLRLKIMNLYPQFDVIQVEGTIQLVYDCIASDVYLDSLFSSLNICTLEECGKVSWTYKFGLAPTCAQFN